MSNPRIIWHMMPGDSEALIRKAPAIRPDVVIPCLEDGVAYSDESKAQAREMVRALSVEIDWPSLGIQYYPRVNVTNGPYWRDDIRALFDGRCDGIVLAKEESPDRIRDVDAYITSLENASEGRAGRLGIIVMVETALGLERVFDMVTACSRVEGVLLGREDLQASLGVMRRNRDALKDGSMELLYARSRVVAACRAADKEVIDGASFVYDNEDYMHKDAALTARLGFTGKLSAHPRHAQSIRVGFAPDPDDVVAAQEMVSRGAEMVSSGVAPVFGVSGMEVTPPIIGQARLILERDRWARVGGETAKAG